MGCDRFETGSISLASKIGKPIDATAKIALLRVANSNVPSITSKMRLISLSINGANHKVEIDPGTPLLWVLRDELGMTGTKFGCGRGICGACTIHLDGEATRSCVLPLSMVGDKKVITIEGLSADLSHPLQQAWIAEQVPQCGYCQSGQIMTAAELLARKKDPTDEEIDAAMSQNLCRCGTYQRIRRAIHLAAQKTK